MPDERLDPPNERSCLPRARTGHANEQSFLVLLKSTASLIDPKTLVQIAHALSLLPQKEQLQALLSQSVSAHLGVRLGQHRFRASRLYSPRLGISICTSVRVAGPRLDSISSEHRRRVSLPDGISLPLSDGERVSWRGRQLSRLGSETTYTECLAMDQPLQELRKRYHRSICTEILGQTPQGYFNNADGASRWSVGLAAGMAERIGGPYCAAGSLPTGQRAGSRFATHTAAFLQDAFSLLAKLRPGTWTFSTSQGTTGITAYDQYKHLAELKRVAEQFPEVRVALGGDYLIVPDIVIGKEPVTDTQIEASGEILGDNGRLARLTPFRADNTPRPEKTLHASISCKWTIRSDRAQNTRTEALNLMRNRKGKSPQMIVVTAEPLPRRLSSIAVGTGDIDCTYHAALYELLDTAAADPTTYGEQLAELQTLIDGRRLRDISDLPFDLAI